MSTCEAQPEDSPESAISTTITVSTLSDERALQELQQEWTDLLRISRANSLFLTWEWVTTWWHVYGRGSTLHVLLARTSAGKLVGFAPLKRVRRGIPGLLQVWAAEFIGQGGDVTPEYLDFVTQPGMEEEIVGLFIDTLLADPRIAVLDLRSIPESSPTGGWVEAQRTMPGRKFQRTPEAVCPILELPQSVAAFHASRSRNYRKKIGEYERKCQRELDVALKTSSTPSEMRADMRALMALHRHRWRGTSRAFQTREYVTFHELLAETMLQQGWLRLFRLDSRGEALALVYCFAYERRYYYYQAGRNPNHAKYRLGLVLMHRAILEAIKEGATVFDFLRGEEQYKNHWAQGHVLSVRLVFWKSASAQIATWAQSLLNRVQDVTDRLRRRFGPGF